VSERSSHAENHDDLGQVLHEEIDRLPERFRVSVVLCDLEGRTHEQAARHLGWPVGTVKSRLTRARERLRDRLTRRGLAPSAGVITVLRPGVMENLLPGVLVQSTASAAVRFGASRTLLGGSAAILAQGVLTAMSMTRWWKVASLLLVAGATVSSAGLLAGNGTMALAARPQDVGKGTAAGTGSAMPVAEVKAGKFKLAVVEHGTLEPLRSNAVTCQVEGGSKFLWIRPEGTVVKKGDLVCELDSAPLRDTLTNQKIAIQGEEAAYQNARLTREVAEIALKEYEEGIYPQERAAIQGEIKMAELGQKKTAARLERTHRARQKLNDVLGRKERATESGDILAEVDLDDRLDAADQALSRERLSLERAQTKLNVLQNYTKGKTIKELKSEVQKAHFDEFAKQQRWEFEKEKAAKLERQIAHCKIYAPAEGVVQHFNGPRQPSGPPVIQAGATARERQLLFRILEPGSPLLVNAKIPEAKIDRVRPGQKARIQVDAYPGAELIGTVKDVFPLPDPTSFFSSNTKVFTTHLTIDNPLPGLRPGMTAEVVIQIVERDDALTVPVSAVLRLGGKNHVAVKKTDGGFEWREVALGDTSGTVVEVKQGLKPFEQVALKPLELIRKGMNRDQNVEPTKPR
jgi:RND family efflux transporter MFP subunit